jgi:ferredoxin
MKVVVDFDICQSNAVCMEVAPKVFEVRDDGYLYVLMDEPPESMRAEVEEAAERCPTGAITIEG